MSSKAQSALLAALALAVGIALGAVGGRRWWKDAAGAEPAKEASSDEGAEKKSEPVALVRTAAVEERDLNPVIEAMGTAVVRPTSISVVSWPGEVMIVRVMVAPGQSVEKGTPLLQVAASPEGQFQLSLAAQLVESTAAALSASQARVERALATRQELMTAQSAADEARKRLEHLRASGVAEDGLIRAGAGGVVQTVRVQAGTVALTGAPLVDVAAQDGVVAQVWITPQDAGLVQTGTKVELTSVGTSGDGREGHFEGVVTQVAPALSQTTRMVEVTVGFDGAQARPGTMLRAALALPGIKALMAPREAVVADGDEDVVFIVRDGKVSRCVVDIGRRLRDGVEVLKGVNPGDRVIVMGQSQVSDGMAVREEGGVAGG